jgi:hypothetical protein
MIYLPWFPNGDPYSPPEPSVYHRYYGDYYQTYDLYMTSLTKLGSILARAINSPLASLLEYDHIFVDAYVPYSMPNTTPWVNKLYEFMKKWAVLDENVLEIYLFGGSHPYGYFDNNQWIWVSSPLRIPPGKERWPGILREGEYLYSLDIEFPIQLVPNTGIHYLTPDGNEVHWVFEHIGKDGLWKPRYPVLENSVVYEHEGLPPELQSNLDTLPDPRTLLGDEIFQTLRKVRAAYRKLVQKTYIPGTFRGLVQGCSRYIPQYNLIDEIRVCRKEYYDQLFQNNIDFIRRKAIEEGITLEEAFLAYVLNEPFTVIFETRSTYVYNSFIASVKLFSDNPNNFPPYIRSSYPFFNDPGYTIWISTTGPTNPAYRLSNYRRGRGFIPDPDQGIIDDILAGRLVWIRFTNYNIWNPPPDELTFVMEGDVVLPPSPPLRVYAFHLEGSMVITYTPAFSDEEIITTVREIDGFNVLPLKVPLDFDDEYYNKYYHCIIYANNNYWGKQSRPTGTVGRLPIFCKRKNDPLTYESLILAPDLGLGDKSLSPEYINETVGNTTKKEYRIDERRRVTIRVPIQYWSSPTYCNGPALSSCGYASRDYDEGSVYEYTIVSSDYRDELEWIRNTDVREDSVMVYKVSNPIPVIDAYWLRITQEENDPYLSLENYTMPDSPRVKEMHLAIQALADAWSAKEMAYKIDPETGEVPDDPAQRERLVANLAWHLLMLCKWNGIQLLHDKNVLHHKGEDRFPIQVVSATGEGTAEVQGHYPFGALAFSDEDEEGKVSQIPGYPPSDVSRPQMAYKLKSGKFVSDAFGDVKIQEGDYVIVNTIQQLLQVMMQDLDKALGMKDLGAGVVPGIREGEVCTYEGLASAISEVLYMNSAISSQTGQNLISSVITQGIVRELLKATGFPLTAKTVEVDVGKNVTVPYPGIPDDSPTHYLMFISLMQTLQPIVASVLEKIPEELYRRLSENR